MSIVKILRDYYKSLSRIEKLFLIVFIIDISGYSLLFISYLIATKKFSYNFFNVSLPLFPLISGIITFHSKTILHGIALLSVHMIPIITGLCLFYTQHYNCMIVDNVYCVFRKGSLPYGVGCLLLTFLILLQAFYTFCLYSLWKGRVWPLVYEFKLSKNDEIRRMYSIYNLQFPILHAKIMIIGFWIALYSITQVTVSLLLVSKGIVIFNNEKVIDRNALVKFTVPFDGLFLLYSIYMVKGVRDESRFGVYIVYIGNVVQGLILYFATIGYCYESDDDSLSYCFKYFNFFDTYFCLACMGWVTLGLSTWNTLRCHKNFGLNLGFYIKYEPTPVEFSYRKKLEKRGSKYSNLNIV